MHLDLENTTESQNPVKDSNPYMRSIIVMSIVSFLAYFYTNSLAPILSLLAKELHLSDIERDDLLGKSHLPFSFSRKQVKYDLFSIRMSFILAIFLYWRFK